MSSAHPVLAVPLSPENEAETAKLESMASTLGKWLPTLESYQSEVAARLARSSDFFRQQAERLMALAAEQHAILPSDLFKHIKPISGVTAEVIVYPNKDRVHKVTKGVNFFGYTLFCDEYRSKKSEFQSMEATSFEYLQRLALANRIFGSDNRFEGVIIDEKKRPHIVTSQHYFNSGQDRGIEDEE